MREIICICFALLFIGFRFHEQRCIVHTWCFWDLTLTVRLVWNFWQLHYPQYSFPQYNMAFSYTLSTPVHSISCCAVVQSTQPHVPNRNAPVHCYGNKKIFSYTIGLINLKQRNKIASNLCINVVYLTLKWSDTLNFKAKVYKKSKH